ncbi:flagellar M-ring protein FliF [Parazoarcus communis]|uniref:Flagellar M-ring protein n=1 Tax=Parazoarcus communis TaxID=41977 RepID=A0A2U8H7T8_9RHOO|nr:flagellar basal-body MS-ring/collar protein FliF [Parazoarcus communis]AWI81640.1 flagellar M-ring protein FliF [Parazoarcus communis]PKO58652.1 MAG: flagellar basal body M-ring protein FliF [Betaproteobacteria bacterium HGW-Betaproteobacteria-19]
MATADTIAATPASAMNARLQQTLQNINALTQQQKLAAAVALGLAIALVVGVLMWNRGPDYGVLFSNLEERDGGQIIAALQQQNVPYRMSSDGRSILVSQDQVHDVRLRLAAEGLPKGGMVGFELMDTQKLGVSQFNEQINYQRALEGELSRTVQSIASVMSARVHLAMPKQTAFLRDDQKPTASVMVKLRAGRVLDATQIAGIVHLVSSSVPRMSESGVSIVNQNGELLTMKSDPLRQAGLDPTQLEYVREVEASFIRRIETIVEPLVGKGNFRAQVTADVDFNQVEQTAETYKPNPSPDQAIRSQQTSEQLSRDAGAQGVPGALTNQPPAPATAPITTPAVAGQTNANGTQPGTSNRSAVLNYELDRTVQHVKQSLGQIKRLSVAVVVNHRNTTLPNGDPQVVPPTDEEIARITNLVREAMGYNEGRGDTLNVASSPFAITDTAEPELPLWKDPEMLDLGKEGLKYLVVLAAILFAYFAVVRPLMRTVAPKKSEEEEEEAEGIEGEEGEEDATVSLSGAATGDSYEARLARAREMARSDPKMVANLIKEWMGVNEEGRK